MIRSISASGPCPIEASPEVPVCVWSEREIRETAAACGPPTSLVTLLLGVKAREWQLRFRHRIDFRQVDNSAACRAYRKMQTDDFAVINARQAWANWRTIPRNLNGRLPRRPVVALDLCSGTGDSSAVLARYCPPGSQIVGIEWNANFIDQARRREYRDPFGRRADVAFVRQSVTRPFCTPSGRLFDEAGVDLINASGAVGCHFNRDDAARIADECSRVLKPGGLALIDSADRGLGPDAVCETFRRSGFVYRHQAKSCLVDRCRQLCLMRV